ncbi:hypothetical protein V3C33_10590 [Micrococcaceae bacterium Sec5.7]
MDEAAPSPPLVAAPRHLHKRPFRDEIPDTLFVSGVRPAIPAATSRVEREPQPQAAVRPHSELVRRRKRAVALGFLILASLSIPAMVLVLIFVK